MIDNPMTEWGNRGPIVEHGILSCPDCGGTCLHQGAVSVFVRPVEDGRCVSTHINGVVAGDNPSPRRDGLTIRFFCETCGVRGRRALNIFQHKGQTFIEWSP
jgi:hypothetical protein